MLAGDTGASNIDPYAEKPTSDNQWTAEGRTSWFFCPILHN
jgi:hypothetical protein